MINRLMNIKTKVKEENKQPNGCKFYMKRIFKMIKKNQYLL